LSEVVKEGKNDGEISRGTASVEWSVFPLVKYPGRTVFAVFLVIVSGVAIGYAAGYWFFGVAGAAVLVASLYNHFFPSYYKLDASGAEVRVLFSRRKRDWDYFRSYYADRMGVMLSTFTYASRLDSFRGMNLRVSDDNREEVVDFLKRYLPRADRKKPK
jgi:hypothetical protein